MYQGQRILAVVPARSGSKGIPHKNLRDFAGVPLVRRAAEVAAATTMIDRAIVSTDCNEIARVAGLEAPFLRPPALSDDRAAAIDVLAHALDQMEELDQLTYDVVILLEPTAPLRRTEHVERCIEKLVVERLDAVWTVSPIDPSNHPLKSLHVAADGKIRPFAESGFAIVARQQLPPLFKRNGVAYAFSRDCVKHQRSIWGKEARAIILDDQDYISIDTEKDLLLSEALFRGAT